MPLPCETREVDGQYVFTHCAETDTSGLWSGSVAGSWNEWDVEHRRAHTRKAQDDAWREYAPIRMSRYRPMQYGLRYS